MALINCPECGTEVSSQAAACIKCGYPLEQARAMFGESGASSTSMKENVEIAELRFEKRRLNILSFVWGGIVLFTVAFVAFGLILSAGIIGKIVGVVVLIFCLTIAGVSVWGRGRMGRNDPLVIADNYVAFEGKKIYARDVVSLEVGKNRDSRHDYYPLFISTIHGNDFINLLFYDIKPDRVGEVADIIAESLKTSLKPRTD